MKSPLIALLIFALIIPAAWFGAWPAWQHIGVKRAEVRQLERQIAAEREANAQLLKIAQDIERYPEQVEKLEQTVPKKKDGATLIAVYEEAASANGLVLNEIAPQADLQAVDDTGEASTNTLKSMTTRIILEGSYEAFHSFLSDVEHSLPFIDVGEITFNEVGEGQNGDFTFEVLISSYYLN